MSFITSAKNMVMEGGSGGVGFVGGGVGGSWAENTFTPMLPQLLGRWTGAGVNFLAKYLLYHIGTKYLPGIVEKGAVKEGIATNTVLDLLLRLQTGGAPIGGPSLFGYQILGDRRSIGSLLKTNNPGSIGSLLKTNNPDRPGYQYGGPPSPAVETRQRRFGAMPQYSLPWAPDVAERERRFGAMPFQQPGEIVGRQTRYGFSADKEEAPNYTMFGML